MVASKSTKLCLKLVVIEISQNLYEEQLKLCTLVIGFLPLYKTFPFPQLHKSPYHFLER